MQDIVDRPASSEAEVKAVGVQLQLADELAIGGDDANVVAGDEEVHLAVAVLDAKANVSKASQVAKGDAAVVVDLVTADAVVSRRGWQGGERCSGGQRRRRLR